MNDSARAVADEGLRRLDYIDRRLAEADRRLGRVEDRVVRVEEQAGQAPIAPADPWAAAHFGLTLILIEVAYAGVIVALLIGLG